MTAATPPAPALDWACRTLGVAAMSEVHPLPGSGTGRVWLLCLTEPRREAVLKLAPPADHGGDERLIRREAKVLDALRPFDVPTPRLIAVDPAGQEAGTPSLLLERAPGRLLTGYDELQAAIPELARALADCQRAARTLIAGVRWTPWQPREGLGVPSWSTREALWGRAIRVVQRFQPPHCDAFIHRDPHPANMLFEDGRVSALLDWPHAGRGPAGVDGSRMAMNLCCLLGMDAATRFRSAFEAATGRRHDPLLDVLAACEFLPDPVLDHTAAALGVDMTHNQARGRLENFLADAMRRMTSRRLS